mmetsp:Transcript_10938/g.44073  ORF Transcript_10938/g.44073 Transcript_10938/m.44073 type:complete len:211 (-) Transcript_10938:469-1101(-)
MHLRRGSGSHQQMRHENVSVRLAPASARVAERRHLRLLLFDFLLLWLLLHLHRRHGLLRARLFEHLELIHPSLNRLLRLSHPQQRGACAVSGAGSHVVVPQLLARRRRARQQRHRGVQVPDVEEQAPREEQRRTLLLFVVALRRRLHERSQLDSHLVDVALGLVNLRGDGVRPHRLRPSLPPSVHQSGVQGLQRLLVLVLNHKTLRKRAR